MLPSCRLISSVSTTVFHQLELVHLAPLHDETENARGELPFPTLPRFDFDASAVIHGRSFPDRAVDEDLVPSYPAPVPDFFNIGILRNVSFPSGVQ